MAIQSTLLSDTVGAISPDMTKDIAITTLIFCNLNTPDPLDETIGRQNIDVYVVIDGDTPDEVTGTNKIIGQLPIDAGDTFSFSTERLVLSAHDTIQANTTTSGQVSVTISYVTI
jgi:hypothetical protein